MKKPMILLTARATEEFRNTRIYYDNESYFEYIKAGGGIPVLAGTVTPEDAQMLAERFDGLLVTGGEDVIPETYGEENRSSYPIDADLEESDILLYRAFVNAGKPVLGICRGMQLIAAAEGGTLIQDLREEGFPEHNQRNAGPAVPHDCFFHNVSFESGTCLHSIFGDSYGVNSFHHQAVRTLPEGFKAAGTSEEGILEAMEKDRVTCVQWHPERLLDDPCHKALICQFVKQCSAG